MRTRRAKAGCVSRRQAEAKARELASGGRKGASAVTGTVTMGTAADSPRCGNQSQFEYTHCLIHKLPRPGFFRMQEVSICYRIERPTKWLNGVWPAFSFFNRKHQSIWHVHKRFWFMNLPFLCICEFTYFVYHMLHLHVRSLRARAFVLTSCLFTTVVCWE